MEMSKIFNGSKSNVIFIFILQFLALRFTPAASATAQELDRISLRIYTGDSFYDTYHDVPITQPSSAKSALDPRRPTLLYLHGFREDLTGESVRAIVDAYLDRGGHNVIAVDFAEIANKTYVQAVESAEAVGKRLAITLRQLISMLDPRQLHIVGFSLGAQMAAYINKYTIIFKVHRLTALDPIGPSYFAVAKRITSADARFVDIIHTDAFVYGSGYASGGADFWPNQGLRLQPGCPAQYEKGSDKDFCNHRRSWQYFAESVKNPRAFMAGKASSWGSFVTLTYRKQNLVPMGFDTPYGTTGLFYLKTNEQSPFGMEENGVRVANE
ncbi:pancreatic triacylglycerol lipase-like [Diprion similis]|uniref:pancreatic triacylglycerol lipase-like n=1 Tax=Diprion similis TaxID=362088 RepID=UPI001EF7AEE4|nr:pancreatic triacylglycerol lipase-like [Diprion similis]